MQVFRNIFVFYGKNPRRGSMGRIQILQLLSCRGQRGPQKSQREHILFINNEFMANFFPRGTEKIGFRGFWDPTPKIWVFWTRKNVHRVVEPRTYGMVKTPCL